MSTHVNGDARQLVWLITGTSSGLGKRLVKSVLSRGDRVIAAARSLDKLSKTLLEEIPQSLHQNLKVLELDITEGEASLKVKVQQAASHWGRIDVLVNNAALGLPGFLEEGGSPFFRKQFETNVFAMVDMITVTLPYIRESKGIIVNVGSRSAWKTEIAGLAAYTSSKAAVHAFSETLAVEVAPFGVKVLIVAPGAFRTEGMYSQSYFQKEAPIAEYDEARELSIKRFRSIPGTEKGDPAKGMELLVDVVRGEGRAKGKPWPGYLFLGEDSLADVNSKATKLIKAAEEWKEISADVNFDE